MKSYNLNFCDFIHYDNGILELVVHENMEVTGVMAQQILDTIASIEPKVVLALINRKNEYSLTFKANLLFAASKLVEYLAVVKYRKKKWPLKGALYPKFYHLAFFDNVHEATEWLLLQHKK